MNKHHLYKTAWWANGNKFVKIETWNPVTDEYHVSWRVQGNLLDSFCLLHAEELSDFVL